ncbi:MAG: UDP-3-O-(3-hydroxymyristoyl)glucosamine N-acyltransferase, partial [Hyphomonadaceae bacterium]|nr:UDP-3-O-(3-hydroxymyristoyl)glucosamine N-acyltransferase [Hyphomonadaceae bacterium]
RLVSSCASLDDAGPDDVAFCLRPDGETISSRAGALIVALAHLDHVPAGCVAILAPNPRGAFAAVARALIELKRHEAGSPAVHPDALIEAEASILPNAIIGQGAAIGAGTVIGAGAVIGPGVQVGRDCRIGAGAVIQCTLAGDRVSVGANSVIGEAGFGVAAGAGGPVDVPQLGRVILQDDVSIGALVAVDRGAFGDTIIGLGSKIDNLCQIAHNVRIGRGVIVAGFSGISGSTVVEDFVVMGGRVGLADHLVIGTGAQLAAGSGVIHDVPAGETWGGYPAKPRRDWVRELASLKRLAQSGSKAGKG